MNTIFVAFISKFFLLNKIHFPFVQHVVPERLTTTVLPGVTHMTWAKPVTVFLLLVTVLAQTWTRDPSWPNHNDSPNFAGNYGAMKLSLGAAGSHHWTYVQWDIWDDAEWDGMMRNGMMQYGMGWCLGWCRNNRKQSRKIDGKRIGSLFDIIVLPDQAQPETSSISALFSYTSQNISFISKLFWLTFIFICNWKYPPQYIVMMSAT